MLQGCRLTLSAALPAGGAARESALGGHVAGRARTDRVPCHVAVQLQVLLLRLPLQPVLHLARPMPWQLQRFQERRAGLVYIQLVLALLLHNLPLVVVVVVLVLLIVGDSVKMPRGVRCLLHHLQHLLVSLSALRLCTVLLLLLLLQCSSLLVEHNQRLTVAARGFHGG